MIAPLAFEAVKRIDAIFDVEREINGLAVEGAASPFAGTRVAPLVADLESLAKKASAPSSRGIPTSPRQWITYSSAGTASRDCSPTDGFALTNNAAERELRGIALGRKSWLYAGSDRGGERAAVMYTLIQTAKLNDIDPHAWLADVLARINNHNIQNLNHLLPWNWKAASAQLAA